jgi:nucleotide-binding universal stress UspA family protein
MTSADTGDAAAGPSVDHVLFATDGSPDAERAAAHAVELAATFDATLHVLSVVDSGYRRAYRTEDARRDARTRLAVEAEAATTRVARRAAAAGVRAVTAVEEGDPAETIADVADDVDADAVVVGTHGRTGLYRFLLGSVAERVLDRVRRSVLAVPTEADDGGAVAYRTVLLATDGGRASRVATDWALALAAAAEASVRALSVVDERVAGEQVARTALESEAREAVRAVALAGAERGVGVETSVAVGLPAAAVVDAAADADVVVVGTNDRTGLDRLALGSVSRRVVRSTPTPVLVARPSDES